jgi:hypothetical protein
MPASAGMSPHFSTTFCSGAGFDSGIWMSNTVEPPATSSVSGPETALTRSACVMPSTTLSSVGSMIWRMSSITKPDDEPTVVRGFDVVTSLEVIAAGGLLSMPRTIHAPDSSSIVAASVLRGIDGPSSGSSLATSSISPRARTCASLSLMLDLPTLASSSGVLAHV